VRNDHSWENGRWRLVAALTNADKKGCALYRFGMSLLTILVAVPAGAQVRADLDPQVTQQEVAPTFSANRQVWRTSDAGNGQTGQRQTRDEVATLTGIEPMRRIGSRVQNRAQTRIRNRIDRYYDPQSNATSPFVVASEQARAASRRSR